VWKVNGSLVTAEDGLALRPAACPNCEYSWQGLPEARCPECGERVEAGEIVLVGKSMVNPNAGIKGENWGREMAEFAVYAVLAGFVLSLLKGPKVEVIFVTVVMYLLFAFMISLVSWHRKRNGRPSGVLRLTRGGFRIGAGTKVGIHRPWRANLRMELDLRKKGVTRIKAYRTWGGVSMWKVFDLRFACESGAAEALLKYVAEWSSLEVEVRR
jgi:hypothetical protein